ncbi:MAG: hypothetical protein WD431_00065 [Cyclobacteriaceae bacterium]
MGFEIEELRNNDIKLSLHQDGAPFFNPDLAIPQLLVDAELTLRKVNLKAMEVFQLDAQNLGKPIQNLSHKL